MTIHIGPITYTVEFTHLRNSGNRHRLPKTSTIGAMTNCTLVCQDNTDRIFYVGMATSVVAPGDKFNRFEGRMRSVRLILAGSKLFGKEDLWLRFQNENGVVDVVPLDSGKLPTRPNRKVRVPITAERREALILAGSEKRTRRSQARLQKV